MNRSLTMQSCTGFNGHRWKRNKKDCLNLILDFFKLVRSGFLFIFCWGLKTLDFYMNKIVIVLVKRNIQKFSLPH